MHQVQRASLTKTPHKIRIAVLAGHGHVLFIYSLHIACMAGESSANTSGLKLKLSIWQTRIKLLDKNVCHVWTNYWSPGSKCPTGSSGVFLRFLSGDHLLDWCLEQEWFKFAGDTGTRTGDISACVKSDLQSQVGFRSKFEVQSFGRFFTIEASKVTVDTLESEKWIKMIESGDSRNPIAWSKTFFFKQVALVSLIDNQNEQNLATKSSSSITKI